MKLIKITLASVALSVSLFANEALVKNMTEMESALNSIQKGFLYNSPDMIKSGVQGIKKTVVLFEDRKETQKYLPDNKKHMSNIAYNSAKRMEIAADELLLYIDAKEYSKASNSYSEIMNSCNACHSVVRGW
jgi:hypothetical protein